MVWALAEETTPQTLLLCLHSMDQSDMQPPIRIGSFSQKVRQKEFACTFTFLSWPVRLLFPSGTRVGAFYQRGGRLRGHRLKGCGLPESRFVPRSGGDMPFWMGRDRAPPIEPVFLSHVCLEVPHRGVHLLGGHLSMFDRLRI